MGLYFADTGSASQNDSNLIVLNWESVVPEVPRTVGLPLAPGEARGKSLGFQPPPPPY